MTRGSHNFQDLTGEQFGRLSITARAPNNNRGSAMWSARCECGREIVALGARLRNGRTQSCGCLRVDALRQTTARRVERKPALALTPEFIEARSIPEPNSGCWIWMGRLANAGYGSVKVRGWPTMNSHRASYIAHTGSVPEGLDVDHLCRNPACVNPQHLEAVTHQENCRRRNAAGGVTTLLEDIGNTLTDEGPHHRGLIERVDALLKDLR